MNIGDLLANIYIWITDQKNRRKAYLACSIIITVFVITAVVIVLIVRSGRTAAKEPRVITLTIDAPQNIPLEEKEKLVYHSLIKAGYSPAGACGIMGNIAVESPDFDPAAVNESADTLGLFQWNDVGNRKTRFKEFCKEHKLNWNSMDSQLAFAIYELSGGDPIACRLDDFLKETDNSYAAAAEFAAGFERCVADSGKAEDRYAGSLYPEFYGNYYQALSKRINKAMKYYIRFVESAAPDDDPEINITIE